VADADGATVDGDTVGDADDGDGAGAEAVGAGVEADPLGVGAGVEADPLGVGAGVEAARSTVRWAAWSRERRSVSVNSFSAATMGTG